MPVNERLMLPGSWEITLDPTTPKGIIDALDFLGHIMLLDGPVDVRSLGDTGIKATARYAGIVRVKKDFRTIGGPGLVAWLGNEQGVGAVWETARNAGGGAQSLATWMANAVPVSIALSATTHAVAGTLTQSFINVTPRFIIDYLMNFFAAEYRIHPDFSIEFGAIGDAALFKATPVAVATPLGGRDTSVVGIPTTDLALEKDADDLSTRVLYLGSGANIAGANAPATPYKDGRGNAVILTRIVSNPQAIAGDIATMAANEIKKWQTLHTQVTLASDLYDVGRDVAPGDYIWVWDPKQGIYDVTQQVRYRGSVIFPMTIRVLGLTWPVENGMGVYYRDSAGAYTDLTPFVVWEQPGVRFELGAVQRRLV